jgi:hypothetical protein
MLGYAITGLGIRRVRNLRLQPSAPQHPDAAVPIAAAIFLDVFNIFLIGTGSSAAGASEDGRRPLTTHTEIQRRNR